MDKIKLVKTSESTWEGVNSSINISCSVSRENGSYFVEITDIVGDVFTHEDDEFRGAVRFISEFIRTMDKG